MIQQLDPAVRYPSLASGPNKVKINELASKCTSLGMDQGFHNYLLYSGQLSKYINIKIFPQGEGPVNTVGGFKAKNMVMNQNLTEIGLIRGLAPNQKFHNWNGDLSPVVHQYDRFE